MHSRMRSMADNFKIKTQNQLPETTKRLLHENNCANTTSCKLDERAEDLIEQNKSLTEKFAVQKEKIKLLEAKEREVLLNNQSKARLILLLTERSENLNYELDLTEKLLNDTRDFINDVENSGQYKSKIVVTMKKIYNEYSMVERKHEKLKLVYRESQAKLEEHSSVIDESCLSVARYLIDGKENSSSDCLTEVLTHMHELTSGSIKNLKIY